MRYRTTLRRYSVSVSEDYDAIVVYEDDVEHAEGRVAVAWVNYDPHAGILGWGEPGRHGREDANVADQRPAVLSTLDATARADLARAVQDLRARVEEDASRLPSDLAERLRRMAQELESRASEPPPWT